MSLSKFEAAPTDPSCVLDALRPRDIRFVRNTAAALFGIVSTSRSLLWELYGTAEKWRGKRSWQAVMSVYGSSSRYPFFVIRENRR